MARDDSQIVRVLGELAELGQQIGERAEAKKNVFLKTHFSIGKQAGVGSGCPRPARLAQALHL